MNYLVMEVHPAYAVVLDEEGRFLKVANLRYQVGQTVEKIVELQLPQKRSLPLWKPLSGLVGLAACLCLVFFGYYQPNFTPYGALRIQINPDVELTLSRNDRVLELEGLNPDGQDLIAGYDFGGKGREDVTGELVERAIDMGYLSDGETVSITVSSPDAGWQARQEQEALEDLEERYGQAIVIQIGPAPEELPVTEVVIPVTPPASASSSEQAAAPILDDGGATGDSGSDYGDTDYGPSADGDSDYGPNADGVTDYGDTDYGPNADGVTGYDSSDYSPYGGEATNDGDTGYSPYSDGDTDYASRNGSADA